MGPNPPNGKYLPGSKNLTLGNTASLEGRDCQDGLQRELQIAKEQMVRLAGLEPATCCSGGSSISFHRFSISHLFFAFLLIGVSALARKLTPFPSIERFLVHFWYGRGIPRGRLCAAVYPSVPHKSIFIYGDCFKSARSLTTAGALTLPRGRNSDSGWHYQT
jgi:hypothetical protein